MRISWQAVRDGISQRADWQRFFVGEGPSHEPVTLNRRRIFILPSREGLIFVLIVFAMLLAAINYRNGMIYLLTFLLAGLGVVAMLHTYRNMARLRFHAGRVEPVFAGETAQFSIQIHNPTDLDRYALSFLLNQHPDSAEVTADILARDAVFIHLGCHSQYRGSLPLGRFTVSSRYPLGLFRAWSYLDLAMIGVVYPAPGLPQPLPPNDAGARHESQARVAGVDDFYGLRGYVPEDSPRHVHWKAVARGQGMVTKEFTGGGSSERWLTWEQTEGLATEARLSLLCRWLLDAEHAGDSYGLRLPGVDIFPGQGESQLHECLHALAFFGDPRQGGR